MAQGIRWVLLAVSLAGVANAHATAALPDDAVFDEAVRDVCGRDVVLLGEERHHGGGATIEAKAQLARRLVDRCGFDQVLFESGFDEFVGFNRALAAGDATQEQLADAVGGIWSWAEETRPLLVWLFEAAKAGKVRVGGIDPQSGSATGHWTRRVLGGTLAPFLPREMQAECKTAIDRNEAWTYDDAHPFDDAERFRLDSCAAQARTALAVRVDAHDEATEMARNWVDFIQMRSMQDAVAEKNVRDRRMHELLSWHRVQGRRKTLVWCASVHAAKQSSGDHIPTGEYLHRELGERMAAIGFTAAAGSYGRPPRGVVEPLPVPEPGSIEAVAAPSPPAQLRYLDMDALAKLGSVSARVLDYTEPRSLYWSQVLDGLIVLGEERPQTPAGERQ